MVELACYRLEDTGGGRGGGIMILDELSKCRWVVVLLLSIYAPSILVALIQ